MAIPRALNSLRVCARLLFSALLFVTTSTSAQSPVQSPAIQVEARYTLQGTILNAVTNKPIGHALVQIFGQHHRSVFTDAEGQFRISNVPQMRTIVNVIKPGFLQEGRGDNRLEQISIGPQMAPVTLKLVPEAAIHGRLTDSSGEPLDAVPVTLYSFSTQDGVRKRQIFRPATQSDEGGEFLFTELPAGDYLVASGPSWKDLTDPYTPGTVSTFAYPQTFFPGVQQIDSGAVIHLAAAQNARADFSVANARTFVVSGTLVGAARNSNLKFVNSSGQEISLVQRREGPEGFRARLPAGPALLKAHSTDQQGHHFYGQLELDVSSDLRGLRIPLEQIEIPIITERESSSEPQADMPPNLRLISLDPAHPDAYSRITGEAGNWTNTINDVEYGRYRVELNSDGQWYPASITYGGVNLISEPLVVEPGASQTIQVRLVRRTK